MSQLQIDMPDGQQTIQSYELQLQPVKSLKFVIKEYNQQMRIIVLVGLLLFVGVLGVGFINQLRNSRQQLEIGYDQVDDSIKEGQQLTQRQKRVLDIESESNDIDDQINQQKNKNEEEDISKLWEYFYIVRQYILTLLLWVVIKFFDNSLMKKDGKYFLNIEYVMFVEGVAFGFFCCFCLFSFIGLILSLIFTYNLKESVQFAHQLDSLYTTLIIWALSFVLIAFFSLTQKQNRGPKEKIILTLGIIPSVFLAFVLPAQGVIILMA